MSAYRMDNPARPFCSERCKLIDLGGWAEERYSISGDAVKSEIYGHGDGLSPDTNDGPRGQ